MVRYRIVQRLERDVEVGAVSPGGRCFVDAVRARGVALVLAELGVLPGIELGQEEQEVGAHQPDLYPLDDLEVPQGALGDVVGQAHVPQRPEGGAGDEHGGREIAEVPPEPNASVVDRDVGVGHIFIRGHLDYGIGVDKTAVLEHRGTGRQPVHVQERARPIVDHVPTPVFGHGGQRKALERDRCVDPQRMRGIGAPEIDQGRVHGRQTGVGIDDDAAEAVLVPVRHLQARVGITLDGIGVALRRAGYEQRVCRSKVHGNVLVVRVVDTDVPAEPVVQPEDVRLQVQLQALVVHAAHVLEEALVTGGVGYAYGHRFIRGLLVEIGALEVEAVVQEPYFGTHLVRQRELGFQVVVGICRRRRQSRRLTIRESGTRALYVLDLVGVHVEVPRLRHTAPDFNVGDDPAVLDVWYNIAQHQGGVHTRVEIAPVGRVEERRLVLAAAGVDKRPVLVIQCQVGVVPEVPGQEVVLVDTGRPRTEVDVVQPRDVQERGGTVQQVVLFLLVDRVPQDQLTAEVPDAFVQGRFEVGINFPVGDVIGGHGGKRVPYVYRLVARQRGAGQVKGVGTEVEGRYRGLLIVRVVLHA